ncbi:MAG: RrF2 family transcriptional regulator [Eggerthellaceae bacterium]
MSITRRCDYACRIIRAAYRNGDSYVSIADVAEQEEIPYSFARSIQHELVKTGLLRTIRGVHGGLALNCDPVKTTVYDVLMSVNSSLSVADCTCPGYSCNHKQNCSFNAVWRAADSLAFQLYQAITLKDLFELGVNHPKIKEALSNNPLNYQTAEKLEAAASEQEKKAAKTPRKQTRQEA